MVPNTAFPYGLTAKGKYTLCNYIMHPLILVALSYTGVFKSCCGLFGPRCRSPVSRAPRLCPVHDAVRVSKRHGR